MTAVEFIDALINQDKWQHFHLLQEKKKFELETFESLAGTRFHDFAQVLARLKNEKKKVEYELPDWSTWRPTLDQRSQGSRSVSTCCSEAGRTRTTECALNPLPCRPSMERHPMHVQ